VDQSYAKRRDALSMVVVPNITYQTADAFLSRMEAIAQEAKKSREFDFIIMDTDAYFDEDKAKQLTIADKVIIVTRQTKASVFSTNILVKNVNGISNEKYLFLCNDFNSNKDNILISSEMELKFTINEYIEHIENYDAMLGVDFAEQTSMKKLAYLLD